MWREDGESFIKKPNLKAMGRYMSVSHCALFVHHSLYERLGCYDTSYALAMDSEWVHRALASGAVFEKVPAVLCNMRMGGVSDRQDFRALMEYRRSVITHGIAGKVYANLFFLFHAGVKVAYRVPFLVNLKAAFDARFNPTVDFLRRP